MKRGGGPFSLPSFFPFGGQRGSQVPNMGAISLRDGFVTSPGSVTYTDSIPAGPRAEASGILLADQPRETGGTREWFHPPRRGSAARGIRHPPLRPPAWRHSQRSGPANPRRRHEDDGL